MNKQLSLSLVDDELKSAKTNKKEFLEKIDSIMPWEKFEELVRPCYYKGERGNKPYDLSLMIRVYILQNLYNLSDAATRNEIIDSRAFSVFCDVESSNQIPDGDTIGRFRNLMIENGIQEKFFGYVVDVLTNKGLILKKGTIVDSTFIEAPSSTKNKDKSRDTDAHSTKKGNTWHFGYKAHVGVDKDSGIVAVGVPYFCFCKHYTEVLLFLQMCDFRVTVPKCLRFCNATQQQYLSGYYTVRC